MPTLETKSAARHPGLTWTAVSGVQPVVYIGRLNDKPLAIVEMKPGRTFHETLCNGQVLGDFNTLEESQRALLDWVGTHST